jgi:hypothetical protein
MTVPMVSPGEFGPGVDQGDDVHLLSPYLFPVSDLNPMCPSKGSFKV